VASLVRYLPLHFSSSVSGVSYSNFKRFSSNVLAVDWALFLGLFQHFSWCPLLLDLPPLHLAQLLLGSNATAPNKVC